MPLTDYFTAADDADAARVLPEHGGPAALGFDTLSAKGIDPAVALGNLESILTDHPYAEVTAASRQCSLITGGEEEGEAIVATVTDTLRDALAAADDELLRHVAIQWAATDELAGASPTMLAETLEQFAALARRALERGHSLYCWWAV